MALNHSAIQAIVMLSALLSSPAWANDVLEVHRQGNISYISGGIGKDESDALKAAQSYYNLRVMNADKSGHFLGNIRIVISDLQQNTLLDANSGPLFYANLPAGRYVVEGISEGLPKKQTVTIAAGKPAHVRFTWPESATDIITN